jgi:hypothetical protein
MRYRLRAEARLLRGTWSFDVDPLDASALLAMHFEMSTVRTDVSLADSLLWHLSPPDLDLAPSLRMLLLEMLR